MTGPNGLPDSAGWSMGDVVTVRCAVLGLRADGVLVGWPNGDTTIVRPESIVSVIQRVLKPGDRVKDIEDDITGTVIATLDERAWVKWDERPPGFMGFIASDSIIDTRRLSRLA